MTRFKLQKTFWLLLGALALLVVIFLHLRPIAAASELNSQGNFISKATITVSNSKKNTEQTLANDSDYVVQNGDKMSLVYTLSFPDDLKIAKGDTYTIYVPQVFKVYNDCNGTLKTSDGRTMGTWTLAQDYNDAKGGYPLKITFSDGLNDLQGRRGTITLNSSFDMTVLEKENVHKLTIPFKDGQKYTVTIKQHTNEEYGDIAKSGELDKDFKPTKIHYTLDFNKSLSEISNPVIKDTSEVDQYNPVSQKLDQSSIKVYQVSLDSDGKVNKKSRVEVNASEYTIKEVTSDQVTTANGKKADTFGFTVQFNHKIDHAYQIEYDASLALPDSSQNGGNIENKASFYDGYNQLSQASFKQWGNWYDNQPLVKEGKQSSSDASKIDWTIYYNLANKNFGNADLTDAVSTGDIDLSTLKVYQVKVKDGNSYNRSESNLELTALDKNDYTVTKSTNANGQSTFELKIKNSSKKGYKITYQTSIPSGTKDGAQITNNVIDNNHDSNHGQASVTKDGVKPQVQKDASQILDNKITWQVYFDMATDSAPDKFQTITGQTLTDHFSTKNGDELTLDKDSIALYQSSGAGDWNAQTKVDPSSYTITTDNKSGSYKGFKLTFKKKAAACRYRLVYTTTRNKDVDAVNEAQFGDNSLTEKTSYTVPAQGQVNQAKVNLTKGSQGLDKTTGLLTWVVNVDNTSRQDLTNYTIKDTIPGDQTIDMDTVKVKDTTTNQDVTKNCQIGLVDTTSTYKENYYPGTTKTAKAKKLIIALPNNQPDSYQVTYQVALGPVGYNPNENDYSNYVNLYQNDVQIFSEDVKADYWRDSSNLKKDGAVDENDNSLVNWKLWVNPSLISYDDAKITDVLDGKQVFNEDSIKVYRIKAKDQYNFDDDHPVLLDKSAYNVAVEPYTVDGVTTQRMVITFNKDASNPRETTGGIHNYYYVTYQTKLLAAGKDRVANDAAIEGEIEQTIFDKTTKDKEVEHTSGDATITGYNVDFDVLKRDGALSSQPVLSDVHFDLYRLVDGKWIAYAKNLATGSNGRISYRGMFTGRYKLVETKAKEGYDTAKPIYFTLGKKDINDDSSKEATITLTDEDGIAVTKLQNVSVKEAVAKKNKPVTLQVLDYPHAGILPHTGGSGTLIFKVIGTVVILAACIGLEIEIFLRLKHSKEV